MTIYITKLIYLYDCFSEFWDIPSPFLANVLLVALRAVPEIILRGGHIFFQTPPPPGHTRRSEPPDPQDM